MFRLHCGHGRGCKLTTAFPQTAQRVRSRPPVIREKGETYGGFKTDAAQLP